MELKIISFNNLKLKELYQSLQLRAEIFVVEQDCVYNDLDGNDEYAHHLLLIDNDTIIAYARILPPGSRFKEASIGRLVVDKDYRFKGLARQVMQKAASWIFSQWKVPCIQISAQKYLKAFYVSLGYKIISDEYLEDGIPHLKMELQANTAV
ncbi:MULTISPECIES: GNAT family N-acetyltransferase [unclassified Carboxylicivirga]|uniref:GNAT family N-acetyltransferase n=1 Tax=Carboxylicivirga TaxID=1628153 RepID=UPI003D324B56